MGVSEKLGRETGESKFPYRFEQLKDYPRGEFVVSADSYKGTLDYLELPQGEIDRLPQGAHVVEAGSGLRQGFARELHDRRPDLNVEIIDPTLSIPVAAEDVQLSQDGDKVYYHAGRSNLTEGEQLYFRNFQQRRLDNLPQGIVLNTSVLPEIKISPGLVDLWLDSKGPCLYLSEREELKAYWSNLGKVLKPEGVARLYPLQGAWLGNPYSLDFTGYLKNADRLVRELAGEIMGINIETTYGKYQGMGVKIKKVQK